MEGMFEVDLSTTAWELSLALVSPGIALAAIVFLVTSLRRPRKK